MRITTRRMQLGLAALVATAAVGGGTAVALAGDDPPPPDTGSTAHDHDAGTAGHGKAGHGRRMPAGHGHEPLAPYDERYATATADEREAADELVAATRAGIAAYADPAAAEAAGYGPPRRAGGRTHHHLDRSLVADGEVLDPAHPEGLVYVDGPDGPQLVGAFFVAPAGTPVPADAGGLVTWHSHDPACAAFWATPDEACTGSRRMLHVWTAETVDLVRRNGDTATVAVTDPFGAPFLASVERAG